MKLPYLITVDFTQGDRGNLIALQEGRIVPFQIKRFFCLTNVPKGKVRGSHVKADDQVLFFLKGQGLVRWRIEIGGSCHNGEVKIENCRQAVYLPGGAWREVSEITEDAVIGVLSSGLFEE